MIRSFLRRHRLKNKALFFREAELFSGFLYHLMKQRKSGERWPPFLPFLAEVMDQEGASTARYPAARNPLDEWWRV